LFDWLPMADTHSVELKTPAHEAWLWDALQAVFPGTCGVACWLLTSPVPPVPETEALAVKAAVESRKKEFALGRAAAREALRKIGHPPVAIPIGEGRAPVWPAGTIGSIAHTQGIAVAVAGRTRDFLGLGVDLEQTGAVANDLWPDLLVPAEHAFLRSIPPGDRARVATAMFAVKEAFYKFQFPLTREWVGFTDVELTMSRGSATCLVRTHRPLPIGGKKRNEFTAGFRIGAFLTLAAVSLSE
jgi:4'-phosphopantetheinyl transferase EntD